MSIKKNRRSTLVFVAGTILALRALAYVADFKVITPADFKPNGRPFSPAIQADGTTYLSGQGSQALDGGLPEGFEERVRQCLSNVRAVLQGGGMDYQNLVSLHVYLTDLKNVDVMNRVYWSVIGSNPPARTVLGIANLPGGNSIEI